jgi:hypothetical protein
MLDLNFDHNGYLIPYDVIDIDWSSLEELFVFSHKRAEILLEFRKFVHEISLFQIKKTAIWIDGSFATMKTSPVDMDLVCFINHQHYDKRQAELKTLRKQFSLLDIYFVREFPIDHPNYFLTNFDKLDWLRFFTRDRHNRKKGILNLVIEL